MGNFPQNLRPSLQQRNSVTVCFLGLGRKSPVIRCANLEPALHFIICSTT